MFFTQKADIFSVDGLDIIFTADQILDIQQLSCQYTLEYERKRELVKCVVSCSGSTRLLNNNTANDSNINTESMQDDDADEAATVLPWISYGEIEYMISIWADDSVDSYIDAEQGMALLFKYVIELVEVHSPNSRQLYTVLLCPFYNFSLEILSFFLV
jgi:hypothetical protein